MTIAGEGGNGRTQDWGRLKKKKRNKKPYTAVRHQYCKKQQWADVSGQARLPVAQSQTRDEPARYASSWMTLLWWTQLPNTANHTSKGILLTEDYSWRERKKSPKQERSDKNKKAETTERLPHG